MVLQACDVAVSKKMRMARILKFNVVAQSYNVPETPSEKRSVLDNPSGPSIPPPQKKIDLLFHNNTRMAILHSGVDIANLLVNMKVHPI
jgi:hypothetical protein